MANNVVAGREISTVLGLVPTEKLGYCQCHEHLFIAAGHSEKINPALRLDDYDLTVNELLLYKKHGGVSLVDAQPLACGRMAGRLVEASQATGVNIIASTGFHKLVFYPDSHWIHHVPGDTFAGLLIEEIKTGMYIDGDNELPGQKIPAKAGIIKTALDSEKLTEAYKGLLTAAARASRATGAPVMCHTELGRGALEVIRLLRDHGVPSDSIIICHLDRRADNFDYHRRVAETGVFVEYDTIGRFKYHSDEEEAGLILRMIENGFEDRILLGLDVTRERMKSYGGDIGLDYILRTFIKQLYKRGIPSRHIEKMTKTNPAMALTIKERID
ncbi:phosphotriesterase family protein [Desulfocucumis palustris]|uniref:phosphotriesterase family protein n=1 Tax=Desulfocucumis palustris TaxID=1898651 RepID=UPI000CEA582B|nr:hypothetical protein [Desulfocucumis palustris]